MRGLSRFSFLHRILPFLGLGIFLRLSNLRYCFANGVLWEMRRCATAKSLYVMYVIGTMRRFILSVRTLSYLSNQSYSNFREGS